LQNDVDDAETPACKRWVDNRRVIDVTVLVSICRANGYAREVHDRLLLAGLLCPPLRKQ
jgi:hypothetical protein